MTWSRVPHLLVTSLIGLLLVPVTPVWAHETGAIHVSTNQVVAGATLTVRGEKLPKSEELKLELRGVLDNYPVGSVKTDTAGAFQMSITVQASVPAGAYTLVVIASDGDVTARADLAVSAAASASAGAAPQGNMAGMPGMTDHDMAGMADERATAAEMVIPHNTTTGGWIVIWAIIVGSLGAGVTLVRKAATRAA
jgi:methionine-rich copper-binding protein CopC